MWKRFAALVSVAVVLSSAPTLAQSQQFKKLSDFDLPSREIFAVERARPNQDNQGNSYCITTTGRILVFNDTGELIRTELHKCNPEGFPVISQNDKGQLRIAISTHQGSLILDDGKHVTTTQISPTRYVITKAVFLNHSTIAVLESSGLVHIYCIDTTGDLRLLETIAVPSDVFRGKYEPDRSGVANGPVLLRDGSFVFTLVLRDGLSQKEQERVLMRLSKNSNLKDHTYQLMPILTGVRVSATPVQLIDGNLVVLSYDGTVYGLRPDGTRVWQKHYPDCCAVWQPPAQFSDGTVILGCGKEPNTKPRSRGVPVLLIEPRTGAAVKSLYFTEEVAQRFVIVKIDGEEFAISTLVNNLGESPAIAITVSGQSIQAVQSEPFYEGIIPLRNAVALKNRGGMRIMTVK